MGKKDIQAEDRNATRIRELENLVNTLQQEIAILRTMIPITIQPQPYPVYPPNTIPNSPWVYPTQYDTITTTVSDTTTAQPYAQNPNC